MVTVVPFPTTEETSNSSISRLAPGRPRPSPPEVEYPSCSARPTSGMPGPWSRAITITPCRSPFETTLSAISPRLAYMRMLRASSEIAAAMTVWSPLEKPAFAATLRPCWRAVTTSTSDAIGTSSSSGTVAVPRAAVDGPLAALDALASHVIEEGQPFLQIERSRDALERQAELHHRKGDLGLDPDDDGLGAAQPRHVRDVAQRAHGERVHDGERRHVHDDAAGTEAPHSLDQRFSQLGEIGDGEHGVNGPDRVLARLGTRNSH